MGNNNDIFLDTGRVRIIDPNNFDYQYGGNVFQDKMNMSVPNEDLSILVQLTTNKKSRTILNTKETTNSKISVSASNIEFINGTNNSSTGNQNYLTTQYTNLGGEVDSLEESLGISSIDIEFNSAYAPMININFIDVRGGALFQPDGKSKYNVLFSLPYPLFELKIKGFYGKPVTYCLHMIKCNVKFNSQSGNFELAAQFIGYTYAMLADMNIGYLKAAVRTDAGKKLLESYNAKSTNKILSINEYIKSIGNINSEIKEQLSNTNESSNNLSIIKELQGIVGQINSLITNTITTLGTNYPVETSPATGYENIVIIKDPKPTEGAGAIFADEKNWSTITSFDNEYNNLVKQFNDKSGILADLKLKPNQSPANLAISLNQLFNDLAVLTQKIKQGYVKLVDVNQQSVVDGIVSRLRGSIPNNIEPSDRYVKFYDFTDLVNDLNVITNKLAENEKIFSKQISEELKESLKSKLGIDSSIRGTFTMLTTHIELFLDLLYNVSARYNDTKRLGEFEKFKTSTDKSFDISRDLIKSGDIYPWPEYIENGEEKYLGARGVLNNPLNVPEIQFVEDLFARMIENQEDEANITSEGVKAWYSFSPLDSLYYTTAKPYDRLDASAAPNDIIRLVMLRAIGFLSFSNNLLTQKEIEEFANSEAKSVISKYKSNSFILQAIGGLTIDKYTNVTGNINGGTNNVVKLNDSTYSYTYVNDTTGNGTTRWLLPVDKGFNNVRYDTIRTDAAADYIMTSYACLPQLNDRSIYIDFIDAGTYNNFATVSPVTSTVDALSFNGLNTTTQLTNQNISETGLLANNGKFGVQEFTAIDYTGTEYGVDGSVDFFSLFYDSSDKKFGGIGETRSETTNNQTIEIVDSVANTTKYDLNNKFLVFKQNIEIADNNYNRLFDLRKDIGNTILNISKGISAQQLSYAFFDFGIINGVRVSAKSLFTSRFYNEQNEYGRAFLFLHCFPWRGLINTTDEDEIGIFRSNAILNTFKNRTGFIQVPELYPAFIGALLWRYELGLTSPTSQILDKNKFSLGNDPINFTTFGSSIIKKPNTNEYLKSFTSKRDKYSMSLSYQSEYQKIESVLIGLPNDVKKKFIDEFIRFVEDASYINSYKNISKLFEIKPKTNWDDEYVNVVRSVNADLICNLSNIENSYTLENGESFEKRYTFFNFIRINDNNLQSDNKTLYNFYTEFKDGSQASNKLKELLFSYKYIVNNSTFIWDENKTSCSPQPTVSKNDLDIYLNEFIKNVKGEAENAQKSVFGSNDNDKIKLEIYRTLKKIYDKWLGDVSKTKDNGSSVDVLFQCCKIGDKDNGRLNTDRELSKKRGDTVTRLIDSFRFISRSYKDIGDLFILNPLSVAKALLESGSLSFYDIVSRILNENNFDFIALPNYINYNNLEELKSVFQPYPYYLANEITTTGPSFVCVYIGQSSTKLDFGPDANYPDDGFNFTQIDKNGQLVQDPTIPKDFTENPKDYEDKGAAFIVRYGQQNQNIFKDISIDQSEFSETIESINVVDAIANRFSQSDQTYIGQNLYNIHSIRSYKVEIETMGNAMIQPMMYFQLDNIPMFRGAYMITKVRHNIKPNYMSTFFSGVRINKNQTPLIDAATVFSSIIDGTNLPPSRQGSTIQNTGGSFVVPNMVEINELKSKLLLNNFNIYKSIKYTAYE